MSSWLYLECKLEVHVISKRVLSYFAYLIDPVVHLLAVQRCYCRYWDGKSRKITELDGEEW